MIKKFYSNRNRAGWRYDAKLGKFYSWGFDIRLADGRRKREPGFVNKAAAELAAARIRLTEKEIRYGFFLAPEQVPTIGEVFQKRLEHITNRRERTRANRVLATLCAELPPDLSVTELVSSHVQKFVDKRKRDGLSPESINRELNIISSALHAAASDFAQLANWVVPKVPRPRQSKRRRERVITAEEITSVLRWLYAPKRKSETQRDVQKRRNVGHVFRVALLTGARKGELCRLRWDHVDWGARVVQITGTKTEYQSTQTVRYLTIDSTLDEILRERHKERSGDFVFTRAGGEVTHYYKTLRKACRACGLAYGREVASGFVTHDARHTAVTRMLQGGIDLATIGSITGHTDRTMILRYGHATSESRAKAVAVLEKFAGNAGLGLRLDTETKNVAFSIGNKKRNGAGGRTRTDMRSEPRQILSLVRIPISPLRLVGQAMIDVVNSRGQIDRSEARSYCFFLNSSIVPRSFSASGALGLIFK